MSNPKAMHAQYRDPKTGILVIYTSAGVRMNARNPKRVCDRCGKPFEKHHDGWDSTGLVVTEEEVSCMRGDDIVKFYHPECFDQLQSEGQSNG